MRKELLDLIACAVEVNQNIALVFLLRKLLNAIAVNKEVVFSGNDYKIEIWAKEEFERSGISNEEFIALAGKLSER